MPRLMQASLLEAFKQTIEIHISNTVGVGQSTAEVIAVRGMNTAKGRAVIVKQVKGARTDREL